MNRGFTQENERQMQTGGPGARQPDDKNFSWNSLMVHGVDDDDDWQLNLQGGSDYINNLVANSNIEIIVRALPVTMAVSGTGGRISGKARGRVIRPQNTQAQ